MMKILAQLFLGFMLVSGASFANDTRDNLKSLFKALDLEKNHAAHVEHFIQNEIRRIADPEPYLTLIVVWANKYLAWENIEGPLIDIYQETFTPEEITQLLAFVQSPAGSKFLNSSATLGEANLKIFQKAARDNIEVLYAAMQAQTSNNTSITDEKENSDAAKTQ